LRSARATTSSGGSRPLAFFIAGILLGAIAFGAGYWMTARGNTATPAAAQEVTIEIKDFKFNPDSVTLSPGTKVTWVNKDSTDHTVTSDVAGGALASPFIKPGESWSFSFMPEVTYRYHCAPHPYMQGTIVVGTGAGTDVGPKNIPHAWRDPSTTPPPPGWHAWNVTLVVKETLLSVGAGEPYAAWTFNGTIPGPTFHIRQTDLVHITLVNQGTMNHSLDFHSARVPWDVAYKEVAPGRSIEYNFTADYAGVFMYHCGANPVMEHIANGMYGMMIVDPNNDTRPTPSVEYALILSEMYRTDALNPDGVYLGDHDKMMAATPTDVVYNGYAWQYHPLKGGQALTVPAGQLIRIYVLDAGPSLMQSFHVIGAIFDKVYIENNPANALDGIQTWSLPVSGGAAFDLVIPDAGLYPFVTHAFSSAMIGAIGVLNVTT
jgi:plastocyanin